MGYEFQGQGQKVRYTRSAPHRTAPHRRRGAPQTWDRKGDLLESHTRTQLGGD
jgi:hypothetical protein